MAVLDDIQAAVINGNKADALAGVQQALAEGIEPGKVLNEGLIPAMAEVGLRFENGEYFVPEMLIA
ncbi:MAG TPA: B12-binding domain-containing protein, partial [Phototrophicaceae bacterium]|nr:B12-binding domain-containing protein [Phototrophicaceae bacterium]